MRSEEPSDEAYHVLRSAKWPNRERVHTLGAAGQLSGMIEDSNGQ